ncbi:MAG: hypothetical protein M1815_001445 [Lichina confinis]|nr:MAG: hypothetical protein M1815_001445 [Lichina confinis]
MERYDLFIPIGANLVDMIRKSAFHQTAEKPGENIPFNYTFGVPIWKYYELHPSVREDFDNYMVARREGMLAQWHEIYPAASRLGSDLRQDPEAVLLVDVGGGRGHDLQSFQHRHPDLPGRLIVQDLPAVLDQLDGPLEGIEVMRYDVFTPQPIRGARAYFFRNILHGWPDKDCIEFLSNTVQAMDKDHSVILIDEFVLPNTGAGLRAVSMDVLMMMYVGAIERTERQWHKLLDAAGLEIVKIWSISPDYESIIEARRKE